ncbi:MAG: DmsE family decaheme c-type cytochrome [Elusimicrobia bacterium]|nr:DmsE family decaheme c-type cytochrome [Elusimicrobiota bacterium]
MRKNTRWMGSVLVLLSVFLLSRTLEKRISAQESKEPSSSKAAEFVGAETCLQCHANRESFKDNIHAKAWPRAKGIEFSKSCETCHGPGSLHASAAGDKNNPDFFAIRNPKKLSSKEIAKTCLECHKGGTRFHWEGSKHESQDVSCLSCHSMHEAKSPGGKLLLAKASVMETCFQCHNTKKAQFQRSSHMPLREGKMSCTDCHNPHGSVGPTLLKQASVNENCLSCHAEKKGPFLWEHAPVRENCLNCHQPHGSQHDRLLKAKRPRLCQQCHIEARHPVTASNPDNLHLAGRSCTECHSQIHGSNHPSGVRLQR